MKRKNDLSNISEIRISFVFRSFLEKNKFIVFFLILIQYSSPISSRNIHHVNILNEENLSMIKLNKQMMSNIRFSAFEIFFFSCFDELYLKIKLIFESVSFLWDQTP